MRTTILLEPDVAAEVERLRASHAMGLSAAVNELIRRGLVAGRMPRRHFTQTTSPMGVRLDVSNIADVLETLDGPTAS